MALLLISLRLYSLHALELDKAEHTNKVRKTMTLAAQPTWEQWSWGLAWVELVLDL